MLTIDGDRGEQPRKACRSRSGRGTSKSPAPRVGVIHPRAIVGQVVRMRLALSPVGATADICDFREQAYCVVAERC